MLTKNKVKYLQSLGQKKYRNEYGVFLAEGPKMILEVIEHYNHLLQELYVTAETLAANPGLGRFNEVIVIDFAILEKISQLTTPSGVVAVIKKTIYELPPVITEKISLALDTIQDPGNLGTIIRTADWFGVKDIFCNPACADCYNPKVVQATMGSILRVRIHYTPLDEFINRHKADCSILAATLHGEPLSGLKINFPALLLMGNESQGVSEALLQQVTTQVTIPGFGTAESLNVSVATGILLSHLVSI